MRRLEWIALAACVAAGLAGCGGGRDGSTSASGPGPAPAKVPGRDAAGAPASRPGGAEAETWMLGDVIGLLRAGGGQGEWEVSPCLAPGKPEFGMYRNLEGPRAMDVRLYRFNDRNAYRSMLAAHGPDGIVGRYPFVATGKGDLAFVEECFKKLVP